MRSSGCILIETQAARPAGRSSSSFGTLAPVPFITTSHWFIMPTVTLREISSDNVRTICRLAVRPEQDRLVATNAFSLAEALFAKEAWYRAICADEQPVGFVMLWDDTLNTVVQHKPEVYLWRLMVAAPFQGQGIGKRTLRLILNHVLSRPGISRFYTSYVPGEASLAHFYLSFGFAPNGEIDEDGEVVIEYPLVPGAAAQAVHA